MAFDAIPKLRQGEHLLVGEDRPLAGGRSLNHLAARDVDRIVVGVDRAGDELFSEARDRVDRRVPALSGDRVGGEQDARRGGIHHLLHDHGKADPCVIDAVGTPVGDRALVPQRRPAAADRVEEAVYAGNVEVRVLLARERSARHVLGSCRRPHCDAPSVECGVSLACGVRDRFGHRRGA